MHKRRERARVCAVGPRATHHLDLDGLTDLISDIHRQAMIQRLATGAVVGQDEGDIDGAMLGLKRKVPSGVLACAAILDAMGSRGLLE